MALLELVVRCARPLLRLVMRVCDPREERCDAVVVVVSLRARAADARREVPDGRLGVVKCGRSRVNDLADGVIIARDARVEEMEGGGVVLAQAIRVSDQHVVLVRDLRIREVVSALLVPALVVHPLVDVRGEDVDAFVDALPQRLKFRESVDGVEIAGAARALEILRIALWLLRSR
jgi:hypothetical protein